MYEWFKFFHLAAGIVWLGGMALVILALRPVAIARMAPPERLALMSGVLTRFFAMVWIDRAIRRPQTAPALQHGGAAAGGV